MSEKVIVVYIACGGNMKSFGSLRLVERIVFASCMNNKESIQFMKEGNHEEGIIGVGCSHPIASDDLV